MTFQNLEQRIVNTYIDMFPPFHPSDELPAQTQEQFYLFMKSVYKTISEKPGMFFGKLHEDDAYPRRFNKASYGKPELYTLIKRDMKEIGGFIECLYEIGREGEVSGQAIRTQYKIKKKHRDRFQLFGLAENQGTIAHELYNGMFDAWKYLASGNSASLISFARCMFDENYPYMEDIYANLFGREVFERLTHFLLARGYGRYELCRDDYSLDYAKNIAKSVGGREAALGNSLHGDPNHIGFAFEYKPEAEVPQYTVLRIQKMKDILKNIDDAPANVKAFVLENQKKCDDCGYCTQTDMTGTRPKQLIKVDDQDVCPLYPGFSFCFTRIDDARANDIMGFIEFMERFF